MSESQPSSRGNPSMADIVRSVAVLGAILVAVWFIGRAFTVTPEDVSPTVDYEAVVDSARPAAEFDLLAPERLPEGWKANSARFTPRAWHLGVLTADQEYIGLEQVKLSPRQAIEKFAPDSTADDGLDLGGFAWDSYTGPASNDLVLVREAADSTIVIVASAPRGEVDAYVSSLAGSSD